MKKIKYTPERCECCDQTTTYCVAIDRGSVNIIKKIARAIQKKGINCIHLAKEGVLNHSELCNVIRPRFHGLVAHVDGDGMQGNFCLTRKGVDFLRGKPIPKYAIVSKAKSQQIGYYLTETHYVTIDSFNTTDDYWEGVNFDIVEGRVISADSVPTQASLIT